MRLGIEKKWYLELGRIPWKDCRLCVTFASGFIPNADPGAIPWRLYWQWSSDRIPHLVWRNGRPIGFCAFGRVRLWWAA